ncbi:hypothetical protein [Thermomonas sp.]|uniref:hypothetical protein n=1 Tax=Thermomonas sp. TaxID=1971895 RepID=UPI00263166FA|nr:hypothetical protein [Thermomonas sp.]
MGIKTARDGQETGEWTQLGLQAAVTRGEVLPTDSIQMSGSAEWKPLADVAAELGVQLQQVEATSTDEAQQEQPTPQTAAPAAATPPPTKSDSEPGCLPVLGVVFGIAFVLFAIVADVLRPLHPAPASRQSPDCTGQ